MKTTTYIIITILLLSCNGRPPIIKTGLEDQPMPSFNLLLSDYSTQFNTSSIPTGKPIVFYSFATWCPYCKAQTKEIIDHIELVKDINIYMITSVSYSDFKKFYEDYKLYKYPNITACIDSSYYFSSYFNNNSVPYFAIYKKDKRLKQVLVGKSPISLIREIAIR